MKKWGASTGFDPTGSDLAGLPFSLGWRVSLGWCILWPIESPLHCYKEKRQSTRRQTSSTYYERVPPAYLWSRFTNHLWLTVNHLLWDVAPRNLPHPNHTKIAMWRNLSLEIGSISFPIPNSFPIKSESARQICCGLWCRCSCAMSAIATAAFSDARSIFCLVAATALDHQRMQCSLAWDRNAFGYTTKLPF